MTAADVEADDDVAVADENVDYDPDLMRLQMNELELDWCDPKKLSLKWSVKTRAL